MRKLPLIIVEWDDITTNSGWKDEREDCTHRRITCTSVGWKVKSTRSHIVITPMRDGKGECDDRQIIPRGCIRSIRRIE